MALDLKSAVAGVFVACLVVVGTFLLVTPNKTGAQSSGQTKPLQVTGEFDLPGEKGITLQRIEDSEYRVVCYSMMGNGQRLIVLSCVKK